MSSSIDSAVAFGLFITFLNALTGNDDAKITPEILRDVMLQTIHFLNQASGDAESLLNFVVSCGNCIIASRSAVGSEGASLYLSTGTSWCVDQRNRESGKPSKKNARKEQVEVHDQVRSCLQTTLGVIGWR